LNDSSVDADLMDVTSRAHLIEQLA